MENNENENVTKVNDEVVENNNKKSSKPVVELKPEPIAKLDELDTPYDQAIEDARAGFMKNYNKSRRYSYISMGLVLVLALGSIILITQNNKTCTILGYCLFGLTMIGMLVYYVLGKNKLPKSTKDYIALVNKNINSFVYDSNKVTEAVTDPKEKVDATVVIGDALYKDITNVASRNVIRGKYTDLSFFAADIGVYSGYGKARLTPFVGKYVSMPNSLNFEGHYVIVSKSAKPVDQPTAILGLTKLVSEDKFEIYGPEGAVFGTDIGNKFVDAIRKLSIIDFLLNVNVSLFAGHTSIYLSYDDEVMTLPFDKPFTPTATEQFKKDLYLALDALSLING